MTLQECYLQCGGDFEGTKQRLPSDKIIERFLLRFLEDGTYQELEEGVAARDGEKAFRAAHTLKGVALNLGLTALFEPARDMAEKLRHGWNDDAILLLPDVAGAYHRVVAAIQAYQAGK